MKKFIYIILGFGVIVLLLSAGGKKEENKSHEETFNYTPSANPVSKGSRMLEIHINEASDKNYDSAFKIAKAIGIQSVPMLLTWKQIETSPNNYGNEFLDIANVYYPAQNVGLNLIIAGPINTNVKEMPDDLANKAFDDPEVIERYQKMIGFAVSRLPDTKIFSISIGNEIDRFLGKDENLWAQYIDFFQKVKMGLKIKYPGIMFGSTVTHEAMLETSKDQVKALNLQSDAVMLTYYPMDNFQVKDPSAVNADFDEMTGMFSGKIIYVKEIGYPSGKDNGSSEGKQAEFVKQAFVAWDKHAGQIKLVSFLNLHEWTNSEVEGFAKYYRLSSKGFKSYLKTLGLRSDDGKRDKPAFNALKNESKIRGWR